MLTSDTPLMQYPPSRFEPPPDETLMLSRWKLLLPVVVLAAACAGWFYLGSGAQSQNQTVPGCHRNPRRQRGRPG